MFCLIKLPPHAWARAERRARALIVGLLALGLAGCAHTPSSPSSPGQTSATGCTAECAAPAAPTRSAQFAAAEWRDLPGWTTDGLAAAWPAWLRSCALLPQRDAAVWRAPCSKALALGVQPGEAAVRQYFEHEFVPFRVANADGPTSAGLITGYYEPLLHGTLQPSTRFKTPLYGVPNDLLQIDLGSLYPELQGKRVRGKLAGRRVVPYDSRAELMRSERLRPQAVVWVDDPVAAFFLEVQGSGRVRLEAGPNTGSYLRLSYADQNGHPYRSIGRWLADQGELPLTQVSMQSIQGWARANPKRLNELLGQNPSVVFFKTEPLSADRVIDGPKGALGVPLTPERSIAIDPVALPLGAPIFLSTTYPNTARPLQRLMVAQDTGGAIRGAQRADFFWGFGDEAGVQAGRMRQTGDLWLLWPVQAGTPTVNSQL